MNRSAMKLKKSPRQGKKTKTTSSSTRKPAFPLTAAVLTVSDSSAQGRRPDLSGPAVAKLLKTHNFEVVEMAVVPDDQAVIGETLVRLAAKARLVVSTGGTGIGPI